MIQKIKNQRGQSLVEYMIIVALMAVGTMGIMRFMGEATSQKLGQISLAIQGKNPRTIREKSLNKDLYNKKDMSNFFHNATDRKEKRER